MSRRKAKSRLVLSVVTPFYNEADCIDEYFNQVVPTLQGICDSWEIVCVDDGSKDDTKSKLLQHAMQDSRVKVLCLSRNFGKEAALTAGLDHASGDAVIPIDADLQDPPSFIPKMVAKWQEGYEVVNAVRRGRSDSVFRKISAALYHRLISILTNGRVIANVGDFRLLDAKVLAAVRMLRERTRYMKGVVSWVGYKSVTLEYDRPARTLGETKFSFLGLLRLGGDGILSFSSKPLQIWLYLGLVVSMLSFIYACYLVGRTLFYGIDLPGYASMMVVILFMGGVQLVSLGVIGEYIARIFNEVKNRPLYIVDDMYGIKGDGKEKAD